MLKIILSYPEQIDNEVENLNQELLNTDIDFFHLNKPDFDYIQFKELIQLIDADLHYKIIIHSHYGLINEFDLAGINLDKKALSQLAYADEVDKCFIQPLVLNNKQIEVNRQQPNMVTYSAFSLSEITGLPFNVEYAFLSPIFDNESIKNRKPIIGLSQLKESLKTVNTKVIALGSVTIEDERQLKETGFSGMALFGAF